VQNERAIPQSLQAAAEAYRSANERFDELQAAYELERGEVTEAQHRLTSAQGELQTAESDFAVGMPADTGAARKRWIKNRDECDFVAARVAGLTPKLTAARAAMTSTRLTLDRAWLAHCAAVIEEFHEQYAAAAAELFRVIDEGLAVGIALSETADGSRLFYKLGSFQIESLRNKKGEFHRNAREVWRQNPAAVVRHDALVGLRNELFGGKE
jgi:hypothetical protein